MDYRVLKAPGARSILEFFSLYPYSYANRLVKRLRKEKKGSKGYSKGTIRTELAKMSDDGFLTKEKHGKILYVLSADKVAKDNLKVYATLNSLKVSEEFLLKLLASVPREGYVRQNVLARSIREHRMSVRNIAEKFVKIGVFESQKGRMYNAYKFMEDAGLTVFETIKNEHDREYEEFEKHFSNGGKLPVKDHDGNFTIFSSVGGDLKLCTNPMAELLAKLDMARLI